jgi:hypothetical protein
MALFPLLTALRDVGRALQYLHEHGLAHGRIAGENVLLNDHSIAFLASLDGVVPKGEPAADLKALGKLLYESVVRQPADAGLLPRELGVELQRDLEYLVTKAARCEYARAGDLAADIDLYLGGKPLVREKDPLWKRLLGG